MPKGPTIPEAERLEQLRLKHLEGMSLAEFHRQLLLRDGYEVSYAAVRNYHTTRKAPVDYYAQVSRVFGIRLEWLLFGEGEMTPSLQMEGQRSSLLRCGPPGALALSLLVGGLDAKNASSATCQSRPVTLSFDRRPPPSENRLCAHNTPFLGMACEQSRLHCGKGSVVSDGPL